MTEEKANILKDYTFIKDIGEGNFGKVKLSVLNATQVQYAIKILDKEKLKTQTKSSSFNEIEIISKLKHQNIINVEKILEDDNNYYIIMEYCEKGELFEYIVNKEKLDEEESSIFFYQLINGVEYIHKQGFVHRDLKPENLLLTKDYKLKIIDFGLCHDFDGTKLLKTKCGSPSYAAPEILKDHPYDGFKTDIWCCGIILYGMSCGYLPFDGDDNLEIFRQIIKCKPEYPSFLGEECINLLIGILTPKPKKRLSINQIKQHPFYLKGKNYYFNKYNKESEIEIEERSKIINNIIDKKDRAYTSIKKDQEKISSFINNKTSKVKKEKNYRNNIYQNIFDNIVYDDEDEKNNDIYIKKDKNNKSNNKDEKEKDRESEKYDKTEKRKINEIAGLINNIKNLNQNTDSDKINEKPSLILRTFNNKFKRNNLKLNLNKLNMYNDKANDSDNDKMTILNYHSNSNPKNKENKNKNGFSLDINILNEKSLDKNAYNRHLMKFDKNNYEINNIKQLKLKKEKLDFFQKFLINKRKNQIEINEESPMKNKELNFNLILTKTKERIKSENKKNDKMNKNINQLTIKKNKLSPETKIIFTEKRKKTEYNKKRIILHSEINLESSPNSINKCMKKNNIDKYYSSIFGTSNEEGYRTVSIKKRRNKHLKINKNFNLKIINLNNKGNAIKKESRNQYIKSYPNNKKEKENILDIIMNKKNFNLNRVVKTEPKYNHFLDKVINKINSNQNKNMKKNNLNLLNFNNKYKNEENKKIIKLLNLEKNKDRGYPYLIKYYKNNSNDETINEKPQIALKDDKKYFLSINPKILENNTNSKEKLKRRFPNFSIYNKNI